MKLREWKEVVENATKSIDCLERLESTLKNRYTVQGEEAGDKENGLGSSSPEEMSDETAEKIEAFQRTGRSMGDVQRIRVKVLMRRAKGRVEVGGWASLQGAEEGERL